MFPEQGFVSRTSMSRVMFNTIFPVYTECMDTCTKYKGARAASFSNQGEMDEVVRWYKNTTIDPVTGDNYEYGGFFWWMPFR